MYGSLNGIIQTGILWAGYFTLGLLFVDVAHSFMEVEDAWGDFFSDYTSGPHHMSRYILLFGTVILATRFLMAVIGAETTEIESGVKSAMQVFKWLNIETLAGGSGAAYLMSKVTEGQILSLFGRKRF
jgi:hypothetical protein